MYVGFKINREKGVLDVVERVNGKRCFRVFPLILEWYYQNNGGKFRGYDDKELSRRQFRSLNEFYSSRKRSREAKEITYERDFKLENKVLYSNYLPTEVPELHISYLDIEVDRFGHEGAIITEMVDKADCPINAISIYNNWQETLYTLMLRPENLTHDEAQEICNKFENTYLFEDETQLLRAIMLLLDDADVCCGWNSDNFDMPYITRRIINLLGEEESKQLCALKEYLPEMIMAKNDFGQEMMRYEYAGKWLADYMVLYKKHQTSVKESYKLDAIAEDELGDKKIEYEGTLDDLYRDDYEKFILYNRQDTMLVKRLDDKKKFIDIHNAQAHDCRVSLDATMGTVGWVDQSIINKAHDLGLKVPDRIEGANSEFDGIVPPGAYVADPVYVSPKYVFSFDMNSLYPTTVTSINLSPETIIGQVKLDKTIPYLYKKIEKNALWKNKAKHIPDWGAAWAGADLWGTLEYQSIINQTDDILTVRLADGTEFSASAKDIYNMIFHNGSNMSISGLGTIIRTDKDGLIPQIFTEWYTERKSFKKKLESYKAMIEGIPIDDELIKQLSE